ncbi:MAG TPA: alpha/beta hydrolase [Xanthobacteraceae bacterium]
MAGLQDNGFLPLATQRLEYRMIGPRPEERPTLVLLHEGLGSVGLWGDFPDRLAAATEAGVFVYSRAGYGHSSSVSLPRSLRYMHEEALTVLPNVLDAIGFRRGLLVGHSDGASIAVIYAGGVQDHRIRGLVLIAPHFVVEDVSVAEIARARAAFESGGMRRRLARWHSDVVAAFRGWNDAWLHPGFRTWDITEYLGYIRVPILIIQGDRDPYGTARQISIAQEECSCPVEVTMLAGVGHSPHREAVDSTVQAIAAFADRLFRLHGEGRFDRFA